VNKEENSRGVRDYIAATCADAVRKMRGWDDIVIIVKALNPQILVSI
jgi:hypothetical protein